MTAYIDERYRPIVRLRLLGSVELTVCGSSVDSVLAQPKRVALLAYLAAAQPRAFHRRDHLLALFWREMSEERARAALSRAVHFLRRGVGPDVLIGRGAEELGLDWSRFWCDVAAFEAAVAERRFAEALDLYRGDLLPAFHVEDAPEFGDALEARRLALRAQAVASAGALAEQAAARGDLTEAVARARQAQTLAPLDEPVARRAIDLLVRAGDRAGAVREFEALAGRLWEELAVEPSAETEALLSRIREPGQRAVLSGPRDSAVAASRALTPMPANPLCVGAPELGEAAAAAPPRRRRVRAGWRMAVAAVAAALVGGSWALARPGENPGGSAAAVPAGTGVVVFPFSFEGDDKWRFLQGASVELLTTDIDGSELRGIDARNVFALIRREGEPEDAQQAAEQARRLGGDLFVVGSIVVHRGAMRVVGAIYDSRRPYVPLARASVDGIADDPLAVLDQLAGRLLAARWPKARRALTETAALTTVLPALKAFLEAERAIRHGDLPRAVAEYRRAIHEDSTFALAYFRLAHLAGWGWSDLGLRADTLIERAQAFAHNLPPRYRAALEALQAANELDPRAEQLLRAYVRQYPDDADGWNELGDWLLHENPQRGEPLAEAEQALGRAVALDSAHQTALAHLFELKVLSGNHAEAARVLRQIPAENPRHLVWQAVTALQRPGPAALESVAGRLAEADPRARDIARDGLVSLTDYASEAEYIYRAHLEKEPDQETRMYLRRILVWIELMQGTVRDAWSEVAAIERGGGAAPALVRALVAALPWAPVDRPELEKARRAYRVWDPNEAFPDASPRRLQTADVARDFVLAIISRRLGDDAAVSEHLNALTVVSGDSVAVALGQELATVLEAWLAVHAGDLATARERMDGLKISRAQSGATDANYLERYLAAEVAAALGDHETSARWYRSLYEDYTTVRTVVFRAPAFLGEARALEALGREAAARERYARVSRLWNGADPELQSFAERARRALETIDR